MTLELEWNQSYNCGRIQCTFVFRVLLCFLNFLWGFIYVQIFALLQLKTFGRGAVVGQVKFQYFFSSRTYLGWLHGGGYWASFLDWKYLISLAYNWCWIVVACSGDWVLWRTDCPSAVCLGSWCSFYLNCKVGFPSLFLRKSACPSMKLLSRGAFSG